MTILRRNFLSQRVIAGRALFACESVKTVTRRGNQYAGCDAEVDLGFGRAAEWNFVRAGSGTPKRGSARAILPEAVCAYGPAILCCCLFFALHNNLSECSPPEQPGRCGGAPRQLERNLKYLK